MYKVMIADNEPIVRNALLNLIDWEALECELVYSAANGKDLIEQIPVYQPDIIISDIKMPFVDGIDVAKYVYENYNNIKVILLTAYAEFSYAQAAVSYNVVEYVTKIGILEGLDDAIKKCKTMILKEQHENTPSDLNILKNSFLKSVMDESLFDKAKIDTLASEYHINLQSFVMLGVKLRLTYKQNQKDDHAFYTSIRNFFSMALANFDAHYVIVNKTMFCIIINNPREGAKHSIEQLCCQLIDVLDHFANLETNIGISGECTGIEQLSVAYSQCQEALARRFLDESGKIYDYRKPCEHNMVLGISTDEYIEKIILEVQRGNWSRAEFFLNQLFEFQKEKQISEMQIKDDGLIICSRCKKTLSLYQMTMEELLGHDQDDILQIDTYSGYKLQITSIVKETAVFIAKEMENKNDLVEECMEYINKNYQNRISLGEIAQHINVNSSYLSRIFKEKTGVNLLGVVNRKKMEAARDYLQNSNLKISEIAERVGIFDTSYFSHFFKKYTGQSPKQFRQQAGHRKGGENNE